MIFPIVLFYLLLSVSASAVPSLPDLQEQLSGKQARLLPAVHYTTDVSDHKHLHPSHNATFFYGEDDDVYAGLEPDGVAAAFTNIKFNYPAVALEHSKYIASVICSKDHEHIYVRFGYQEAYATVKSKWSSDGGFLLIGHGYQGCVPAHTSGDRFWALTSEVHFDDKERVAACKVKQMKLEDVADTMDLEYGKHVFSEPEKVHRRYVRSLQQLPKEKREVTRTIALTVPVYDHSDAKRGLKTVPCSQNTLVPIISSSVTNAKSFCKTWLHQTATAVTAPTQVTTVTVTSTGTQVLMTTAFQAKTTKTKTLSSWSTATTSVTSVITKSLRRRHNVNSVPTAIASYDLYQISRACLCIAPPASATTGSSTYTPYKTVPVTISTIITKTSQVTSGYTVTQTSTLVGYTIRTVVIVETATITRSTTSGSSASTGKVRGNRSSTVTTSSLVSSISSGSSTTLTSSVVASTSSSPRVGALSSSSSTASSSPSVSVSATSSISGSTSASSPASSLASSSSSSLSSSSSSSTSSVSSTSTSSGSTQSSSSSFSSSSSASSTSSLGSPISTDVPFPTTTDPIYPSPTVVVTDDNILNFDQYLDNLLGTLDSSDPNFLSTIMPGVDFSSLSSRSLEKRGKGKAVLGFLKKEVHKAAQTVSTVYNDVKKGAISVGQAAQKIGAKALNSAKKAAGAVAHFAKKLGAGIVKLGNKVAKLAKALFSGISTTVHMRVPPVGYLSTIQEGIPIDGLYGALLFKKVINEEKGQEVKFFCVGCYFNSTFQMGGKISLSLTNGFAGVLATLDGPMELHFNVAVVAEQGGEIKDSKQIISVPLIGVALGELGEIGLTLDFSVGYELSLKAEVTFLQNMTLKWDHFHGSINMLVLAASKVSGLIPNHFYPAFEFQGDYTLSAGVFINAALNIGISLFDGKHKLNVGINERPTLEASLSEQYGFIANGEGFAPLDCEGYDLAIKLKNDVFLSADVVKSFQLELNHIETALWETCFGLSQTESEAESSTSKSSSSSTAPVAITTPNTQVTSTPPAVSSQTPIPSSTANNAAPMATCQPGSFQNYGNVLEHNFGDDMFDFDPTCYPNCQHVDDSTKITYLTTYDVPDIATCCNYCHAQPGGCVLYFLEPSYTYDGSGRQVVVPGSFSCTSVIQTAISDGGAPLSKPWPSICPYGGIQAKGYGPGQGNLQYLGGFSGELGACASSNYVGNP